MARTYVNKINEVEVSIAVQRLLVANQGTAYDPASDGRVDPAAPPTGFVDLGAVVEDSPNLTVNRTKFNLDAGVPAVRQFSAVTGLNGTFEISLHSNHWRKVQFAFGNVSSVSSTTLLSTIASVTAQNIITFANTSDVESLVLGRQFAIAPAEANFDDADTVETRVRSITSDGLTFTLDPTPVNTIAANDVVGIYDFVQQFIGTVCQRQHSLLAVADFIDGAQVVHEIFKAEPGEEFSEAINPTENERIPLSFDLLGVERSDIPGVDTSQLVIARRIYFPGNDTDFC